MKGKEEEESLGSKIKKNLAKVHGIMGKALKSEKLRMFYCDALINFGRLRSIIYLPNVNFNLGALIIFLVSSRYPSGVTGRVGNLQKISFGRRGVIIPRLSDFENLHMVR